MYGGFSRAWWLLAACAVLLPAGGLGHGRLVDPPSRSSCWRYGFPGCVANYNDNELFCGGKGRQWNQNGGNCGVCGDAWDLPQPRENEAGGTYGQGVIVGSYQSGQMIDITIDLTAPHLGWFEFRLCKNDDINQIITHDCLDENLLVLEDGNTRFYGDDGPLNSAGNYVVTARLPPGLTCTQCVLQWKYNTGNTWGCEDGDCGSGLGPQEQFYGCADIEIA